MGALTASLIAIAGIILGWITIEMACKPCLEKGREAMDRNLNPDYDPDDHDVRAPLNPDPTPAEAYSTPSSAVKTV
nr:outer envelope membrane protein 7 [Ipomoea batatas]GMD03127.1 outer envelope membrane protein 7 [Ipomoea batatas]GMD05349.1 outer envelope membrane protein 7 [Ipomoea batatas]GME21613.1 outer envelope membrane protein 7 [Ipomoea batatas]